MKKLILLILSLILGIYGGGENVSANVTVTVYNPVAEQCNYEYWRTASYKKIDTLNPLKHRWIAVSRNLESEGFVFGRKVMIEGVGRYSGIWTIEDRMNKRWVDRIDLLIGEKDKIGRWENINIQLLDDVVHNTE